MSVRVLWSWEVAPNIHSESDVDLLRRILLLHGESCCCYRKGKQYKDRKRADHGFYGPPLVTEICLLLFFWALLCSVNVLAAAAGPLPRAND